MWSKFHQSRSEMETKDPFRHKHRHTQTQIDRRTDRIVAGQHIQSWNEWILKTNQNSKIFDIEALNDQQTFWHLCIKFCIDILQTFSANFTLKLLKHGCLWRRRQSIEHRLDLPMENTLLYKIKLRSVFKCRWYNFFTLYYACFISYRYYMKKNECQHKRAKH